MTDEIRPEHHHPRCPLRTLRKPNWSRCSCGEHGWDPAGAASIPAPGPPPPARPAPPSEAASSDGALTDAEHRAMALSAELWNLLAMEVVGAGRSRDGDLRELVGHVHAIQHAVLSQAGARAYPDRYRLLGGVLADG